MIKLGRKTNTMQILLALEKVHKININQFRYKMITGRLWNDYDITLELGCGKLTEVYDEINRYMSTYRTLAKASISELKKKGWITPTAITKVKKIVNFMEMKKGTHIKK